MIRPASILGQTIINNNYNYRCISNNYKYLSFHYCVKYPFIRVLTIYASFAVFLDVLFFRLLESQDRYSFNSQLF